MYVYPLETVSGEHEFLGNYSRKTIETFGEDSLCQRASRKIVHLVCWSVGRATKDY